MEKNLTLKVTIKSHQTPELEIISSESSACQDLNSSLSCLCCRIFAAPRTTSSSTPHHAQSTNEEWNMQNQKWMSMRNTFTSFASNEEKLIIFRIEKLCRGRRFTTNLEVTLLATDSFYESFETCVCSHRS